MMGGMVPYPRDSSRPSSVFSKEVGMSVDDEDEYDGSEADGMEPDGDGADPFVPMLEDDGHRLGRPARRGVGVVGFVPAPTRLSIPELDWLMRVRDGAGRSVRVPEHRYSRSDRDAVESARGRLYSMVSKQVSQTKSLYKARQRDEEGMLPLGSASPLDMITRDFNERPLIPWHQTSTGRAGVLTTFVAGSGAQLIPGPPIGVDALSRELFQFDCWGTYDAHMTTSPDLFFSGLRGQGKSYCAKTIAVARDRVRTQHHRPIRPAGRMEGHRAGHSRRAGRLPRQRQLSEPVRHARHVPTSNPRRTSARCARRSWPAGKAP